MQPTVSPGAILDGGYDVTCVLGADAVVTWASRGVVDLIGWPASDLVGHCITEIIDEGEFDKALLALERLLNDINTPRIVVSLRHVDGSMVPVEITAVDRSDDPEINGIVVHCRRALRLLADPDDPSLTHLLFTVLHQVEDGVVALDLAGQIMVFNRAMALLAGWPLDTGGPGAWPSQTTVRTLDGRELAPHDMPHIRAIRGQLSADEECVLVRPDGSERRVRVSAQPLVDSAGARNGAVMLVRDVTEQVAREEELHRSARSDPLTGLANRYFLLDEIAATIGRATQSGTFAAVLFCDLDNFKFVNDSLGHGVGDALLIEVADRLTSLVRNDDIVARFGGDEFVLVVTVHQPDDAVELGHRLVEQLRRPLSIDGRILTVTGSVGVALASPSSTPDELVRDADSANYLAKNRGRDRCEVFEHRLLTSATAQLDHQAWLRGVLDENRVQALFQPIVDRTGQIVGVEALARCRTADGQLVPPEKFIDIAEQSELIVELDTAMLEVALKAARMWREKFGDLAPQVGCNVSARQLRRRDFASVVLDALARHAVPPEWLALELTERSFISPLPDVVTRLRQLRGCGVDIGLDDFGTAYATMQLVNELPLSFLKIDRSFVRLLPHSPRDVTVVRCIVDMACALGLEVCAEGVERDEQLELVRELGCTGFQGHLFAPAVSAEEISTMLERSLQLRSR